jgi:hypothetical protein
MAASALVDAGFLVALLSRRVAVSQATQPDHVRGSREFSWRADPARNCCISVTPVVARPGMLVQGWEWRICLMCI